MTRRELQEIEAIADGYIRNNLDKFDPFNWEYLDKANFLRKTFSELALYLHVREECDDSNELYEFVLERVNDSRFRKLLLRTPDDFRRYGFPCIVAKVNGHLDEEMTDAIDKALQSPGLWGEERRPHELVDLLYQCHLWGYYDHGHELDALAKTGNLVNPPDMITSDIRECYALTHNVMLLTNFGMEHPEMMSAPLPYDIETTIKGHLLKYIELGDPDIVVELLATGALQQCLPPDLVNYAVTWILEENATDEHLIGPRTDNDSTDDASNNLSTISAEGWEPEMRHWAQHYHVNIAAGMATKVLETKWEHSVADLDDVSLEDDRFEDLRLLGRALLNLESYDLGAAVDTLSEVDDDIVLDYPGVYIRAVSYLQDHYAGDGDYGYWVDERRLYNKKVPEGDFQESLVDPISDSTEHPLGEISDKLNLIQERR